MEHAAGLPLKNLVICCDGTATISENSSNVLKLHRYPRKTDKTSPQQVVFCDLDVGAVTEPTMWHQIEADSNSVPSQHRR